MDDGQLAIILGNSAVVNSSSKKPPAFDTLDAIFKDRLVLHHVRREDIPVGWLAAWGDDPFPVDILLEVNDRTVNVYFKAAIVSCDVADPDNLDKRQTHRDLILAWNHTY